MIVHATDRRFGEPRVIGDPVRPGRALPVSRT